MQGGVEQGGVVKWMKREIEVFATLTAARDRVLENHCVGGLQGQSLARLHVIRLDMFVLIG